MTRDQVHRTLVKILSEDFQIDPDKIVPQATFRGTLGLDSLMAIDMIFFLEQAVGVDEGVEAYADLETVEQLVSFVTERSGDRE